MLDLFFALLGIPAGRRLPLAQQILPLLVKCKTASTQQSISRSILSVFALHIAAIFDLLVSLGALLCICRTTAGSDSFVAQEDPKETLPSGCCWKAIIGRAP
jgi:hypothetical protein